MVIILTAIFSDCTDDQFYTSFCDLNKSPYVDEIYKEEVKTILVDDTTFINDAFLYDNIDKIVLRDEDKSLK